MHRSRHRFALEMRRAPSVEAASQALGHADLATTMRHYGDWQDDEVAPAFEHVHDPDGEAPKPAAWMH